MDRDELLNKIIEVHNKCALILRELFDKYEDKNSLYFLTAMKLFNFITERMSAIVSLVNANLLWDAEIICRSMAEASIKLLYISLNKNDDRNKRMKEYWEDYEEINTIKQSEISKKTIDSLKDFDYSYSKMVFGPMILSEIDENNLRDKWPYRKRKELERKWSFSEMIKLISSKDEYSSVIQSFLFNYMRSSHLIHADETGILIIEERKSRSITEIDTVENSHFCDILRKTFEFKYLCAYSIAIVFGNDCKKLKKLYSEVQVVYDEMDKIINKVFEDPMYYKYK